MFALGYLFLESYNFHCWEVYSVGLRSSALNLMFVIYGVLICNKEMDFKLYTSYTSKALFYIKVKLYIPNLYIFSYQVTRSF